MRFRMCAFSLSLLFLSACAVKADDIDVGFGLIYTQAIFQLEDGSFISAAEASLMRGRIEGARTYALERAIEKCSKEGKNIRYISEESHSNFLLNGISKINFSCA